ncbi:MAG: hypothetical protein JNK04_03160, partial [Myxococcales bacterium]|nr:hypothetical protein [Myxococcales bacterium]
MPQLDSLLSLVTQQGANELRLGSDKSPAMFANGVAKKLTIPATSTETLRELFGELLDEPKLAQLDRLGRVEFGHQSKTGPFQITLTKRPGAPLGFDAIVLQGAAKMAAAPAAPLPVAPLPAAPPPAASAVTPMPGAVAPPRVPATPAAAPATPAPATTSASSHSPYRLGGGLGALVDRAMQMGASDLHLAE